jgi:hypothetical protein
MNGGVLLSRLLIRRRVRGGHDDNVDLAASLACTYLPQNFLTVEFRQIEVKQKKIRTGEMRSAIKVREKRNDRRAVGNHAKLTRYLVLVESFAHENDIRGIILGKDDTKRRVHAHILLHPIFLTEPIAFDFAGAGIHNALSTCKQINGH